MIYEHKEYQNLRQQFSKFITWIEEFELLLQKEKIEFGEEK